MPSPTRLERVRGCLLGLAIGDALGAPLEGLSSQQIRSHYDVVNHYVDGSQAWRKKPNRWRLPGLYTDDTQQALALAEVLLECGTIDINRLATLYLDMACPPGDYLGVHRGIGRSFRKVIDELQAGTSPLETGQSSAGIGAAMRIAPVAIYLGDDQEALFRAVLDSSLMTHRDVRSLAGALAVAHAARRLLDGEERTPSFLLRLAGDVARDEKRIARDARSSSVVSLRPYGRSLSTALAHAESLLELPRNQALGSLVEEANRHGANPLCKRATMGFPPACIPTCLHVLLTTDTFEEALVEIVNLGGDADSAGAILGALAGAHYGVDAIPKRWLADLKNYDALDAWARALAQRSKSGLKIPDLVERERELSGAENDCRRELKARSQNGDDLGANRYF